MNINVDNLGYFYLTLAIVALAIAIVVYAMLRYDNKPRKR